MFLSCSGEEYQPEYRAPSAYTPLHTFQLPKADSRQYQQQYGDLYFLRLAKLKPAAEKVGREAWDGFTVCNSMRWNVRRSGYSPLADCRRKGAESGQSAGCATGSFVLGYWYRLHGLAVET